MDSGWIKVYRKIESSRSASRGVEFLGAMVWLILNARHDDGWHKGRLIKRGQLFVGRQALSEAWNVSEKKVRIILDQLECDSFFTRIGASSGTLITICNYDTYQSAEEIRGQQRANEGPTAGASEWPTLNNCNEDTCQSDEKQKGPTRGQRGATNKNERINNILSAGAPTHEDVPESPAAPAAPVRAGIPTTPDEVVKIAENAGRKMTVKQAEFYLAKRGRENWQMNDGRPIRSIPCDIIYFLLHWQQNDADRGRSGSSIPRPATPISAPVSKFQTKKLN